MTVPDSTFARSEDQRFMALALALGRRGLGSVWPNPAVGAVVVRHRNGAPIIVGRGWTQPGGRPHAETEALGRAGGAAHDATLYVTLEPCSHHGRTPPCVEAIVAAGITRVVSAIEDPNPMVAGEGHARLRAARIAVEVGVCAQEANHDNAGHFRRMRDGRPHVLLKLAVSADGKVALPGRRPLSITGDITRSRVHALRATNDAILVGIGTVLADNPQLTCRLPGMAARSPVRIVLDTNLRLPLASKLVQTARDVPVWAIAGLEAPRDAEEALRDASVEVLRTTSSKSRVDLRATLKLLAGRGITRLMVESGPRVAATFVTANLVDEAALFRSRKVVAGSDGIDAFEDLPLSALTQSSRLTLRAIETAGEDSLELFQRV